MTTSRIYLEAAVSSNKGINKNGVEAFYDYIKSELNKHKNGYISINCYENPLQITLCVYFVLLSNHRFYKSYNSHPYNSSSNINVANNAGTNNVSTISSFMSDGSDIMKDKHHYHNIVATPPPPPPPTNSFQKVSQFFKATKVEKVPPFPIDMLYALPVTGCIRYLQLQGKNNQDRRGKDQIDKSIEKCIYLIRHHYPHLLFWLDVNSLLISPKFGFLQYGLNLDLMTNQLYFNSYGIKGDLEKIHESFIKDFNNNQQEWIKSAPFKIPQILCSLVTDEDVEPCPDIELLPSDISLQNVTDILSAMAASFKGNDLLHHKLQYIFCYWWHKYSMYQPLGFICLSLQSFVNEGIDLSIR